jgi:serine/threonine-protein kinase
MGTVYLCEHAVLHRRLAVKVLRADLTSDPELVDRFRNEAIAASRIGQENVVDVLDFGADDDGALYYVMEALDGRSLGALIRDEGALPVPRALDLLEQICRALAAAHARGVVHRDVKPDNVFLVRRENGTELAKVIDFGISHVPRARGSAPITRTGAIIGTPEYMAPEQAAGAPIDSRTDVYAAGVLAFEMLTGELPIEAATPIATLVAHQTRTPDPPSRRRAAIPPEVDALVLRALAKRPEDRFESMEALAAEIARVREVISGRPTVAYPPPRPSWPRGETVALPETHEDLRRATLRGKPRRGAAAIAVALGAAAVIAGAGWFVVARMRAKDAVTGRATGTASLTPAPTATPNATPTPTPAAAEPAEPIHAPALVEDAPARASLPSPAPEPARPKKAPSRAATVREEPDLKDPYSDGDDLKDPFR